MKELYIVRHAIAEDRSEFSKSGLPDSERPITSHGRQKMIKISEWLKHQVEGELDLIAYSPLVRSRQTFDVLKQSLEFRKDELIEELDPKVDAQALYEKLKSDKRDSIMIVGHEPQLTDLIQTILSPLKDLTSKTSKSFKLKKGGIVYIEFKPDPVLQWFVAPKNTNFFKS